MSVADWLVYHLWVESPLLSRPFYWFNPNCICALAFGRNTWTDREIKKGALRPYLDGLDPEIEWQKVFERLRNAHFNPGRPNTLLAEACFKEANQLQRKWQIRYSVLLYAQWEVLYAMWLSNEKQLSDYFKVRPIWPKPRTYLSSLGVLEATKTRATLEMCGRDGFPRPLLIAQRYHMPRVERLACRIFGETRVSVGAPVYAMYEEEYFDPDSKQSWTRSRNRFIPSEMLRRAHHEALGWT